MPPSKSVLLRLAICAAFIALGWPFARGFGIEVDEALAGCGIIDRFPALYSWRIAHNDVPVMVLSYLGALKNWIASVVFLIWRPSALSLRLPLMIAGAVTLWLFWHLLNRAGGRYAAWIGMLLLATDPSLILNTAIDFGPIVLNQLLRVAAVLLLVRYHRTGRDRELAAGFFLLGLAMWDKAIFAWALTGLAVAAAVAFHRELRAHLNRRTAGVAAVAFVAGALPLIVYNAGHHFETFRSNAKFSTAEWNVKLHLLRGTTNGAAMFGFMTANTPGPAPHVSTKPGARLTLAINDRLGEVRTNFMDWIWLVCAAAVPLWWRSRIRKPMLFAIVFLGVTWLQMLFTANAGGATHHVLVLWPYPIFTIALVLGDLGGKFGKISGIAIVLIAALLCGRNLLLVNQYYADLERFGTTVRWSDAFPMLLRTLEASGAGHVYIADWGIIETVSLVTEGSVPVISVDAQSLNPALFQGSNDLFVTHPGEFAQMPALTEHLEAAARAAGYQKETIQTIYDRHGRGIFELFRFRRAI